MIFDNFSSNQNSDAWEREIIYLWFSNLSFLEFDLGADW